MRNLLLAAAVAIAVGARAHPHMWVDVRITPHTDADGNITALHQRWQLDPYFSAMMREEIARAATPAERERQWQALVRDIRETLTAEGFYTHPRAQFARARNMRLSEADDGHLIVEVELPLQRPTQRLRYRLYEPEYYVEILHEEGQPREFARCRLTLAAPMPDAAQIEAAAALDQDGRGDPELGQYFAESAELHCR